MSIPSPEHAVGARVHVRPIEGIDGRVVCVYWDAHGLCYDVRYFSDGEARTCRLFPDEIEAAQQR